MPLMTEQATIPDRASSPSSLNREIARVSARSIHGVLFMLRWLIGYGQNLTRYVQEHAADPHDRYVAQLRFGTIDLSTILARLAHGLALATALEQRLARRAARGQEMPKPPKHSCGMGSSKPAANRGACRKAENDQDRLGLPSAQEIARRLRHRSVGAVLVDICLDFGILPGHLGSAWADLTEAVFVHGGSMLRYFRQMFARRCSAEQYQLEPAALPPPLPAAALPAPCTGPP